MMTRTIAHRRAEVTRLRDLYHDAAPGSEGALALTLAERSLLAAEVEADPRTRHVDRPRRARRA